MKSLRQVRSAKKRPARQTMRRREDAGAAAVEFALVLPILLALVFGIIYFGYIFAAQISLNSSARDAARAGVVQPLPVTGVTPPAAGTQMPCSAIANLARAGAATVGLDTTQVIVAVTGPGGGCNLARAASTITGIDVASICTPVSGSTVSQLNISLTYTADSPVPLVPRSSVILRATGAFQCEYS